jgi:hypothetical protein
MKKKNKFLKRSGQTLQKQRLESKNGGQDNQN